ncbi:MAG: anthranilate synthase component I [Abditibacteriales bacterium]|nr:anthranilate synthase component I [Abditibacteriales bacterium]MDW8367478.1 anthranilate synthase component I [Abditibacteriales bacterium]
MLIPAYEEFVALSRQGNLIPVYREILADMETPVSAFKKLAKDDYAFLLESVEQGETLGRYSFLGTKPLLVMQSRRAEVTIERSESGATERITLEAGRDPLHILEREMQRFRFVASPALPRFCGGMVGYLGYDLVRFFEPRLPDQTTDDLQLPDCQLMLTDVVLIFDHVQRNIKVLCNAHVKDDPRRAYDEAAAKIEATIAQLRTASVTSHQSPVTIDQSERHIASNFSREGFEDAVRRCKEYIAAGDCIQVVLSQRFETDLHVDTFDVYRALRSINPSPYMFYLTFRDVRLVGSSPEILVTEDKGVVRTRPLAGTRRRAKDKYGNVIPEEDDALMHELLADEKERAEHVMLVDLGRNDIGRVCQPGTVRVNQLMQIEKYSHVMHIYSDVTGELDPRYTQFDVLRAAFPAGTVSGAPKIRAMEIIDELEPTRRGPYAGAVGYFSFSGSMDTCITIRTLIVKGDRAYVQAGAGIVADSVPANEYQETVNKARAMFAAVEMAERGLE